MAEQRQLFVGSTHVTIDVDSVCAPALEHFDVAWGGCLRPRVPPLRRVHVSLMGHDRGMYMVTRSAPVGATMCVADEVREVIEAPPDQAHWAAERAIYAYLALTPEPGVVALHAAGVTQADRTWIFLGVSNSGKSSLSLAALELGYRVLSDDQLYTDGARLWGIARAIQFDRSDVDDTLPPWLTRGRALSRRPMSQAPSDGYQPFCVPSDTEWQDVVSTRTVAVVRPALGPENKLTCVGPAQALRWLIEASHHPPSVDLGALIHPARAYHLQWEDPQAAIRLLEAAQQSEDIG